MMFLPNAHDGFQLSDVTVQYGAVLALNRVPLSIDAGEHVAFIGPSGSGKTTLLRLLNGMVRPKNGCVMAQGKQVADLSPGHLRELRSQIGFIHQDLCLVPSLRVIRNVMSGGLSRKSLIGAVRAMICPARGESLEAHRILERVGIAEKLYERTDRLSGGQQQRVAIARALFQRPRALLADEPVSSVDPVRAHSTVSLLTRICREQLLTLCVSLHNTELARSCFQRLIGLRDGAIVFDCPSDQVGDTELNQLYRIG